MHTWRARARPRYRRELSALQPVLERMLAEKPEARYPDMAAMLLDLGRHLLRAPELLLSPPGAPVVSPGERLQQLGFQTTGLHAHPSD